VLLAQTRHAEASGLTRKCESPCNHRNQNLRTISSSKPSHSGGLTCVCRRALEDWHSGPSHPPAAHEKAARDRRDQTTARSASWVSSFEGCQRSAGAVGSYCLEMVGRESCGIVSVRTGCGVKSGAAKNRLHELSGRQALDKIKPIASSSGSVKCASGRVLPRSDRLQSRLRSQAPSDPLMPPRARCGPRQWFFSSSERRRPSPG
jgi:hypothetical protein